MTDWGWRFLFLGFLNLFWAVTSLLVGLPGIFTVVSSAAAGLAFTIVFIEAME